MNMSSGPVLLETLSGRVIPFGDVTELSIGRSLESSVNILSTFISRNQCVIIKSANNEWILHDKSRFKSTILNGHSVPPEGKALKDKDEITFVYFKDMVYHFYSEPPSDPNPCKKRKVILEADDHNDIVPTQGGSSPVDISNEVRNLHVKLASKEDEISQLRLQKLDLELGNQRLSTLIELSNEKADKVSKKSDDLQREIESRMMEKSKLEKRINELEELQKDAEVEIQRLLAECRCRFDNNSAPCENIPGNPESSFVFPEEDPFLPPEMDADFESPHCTINGKVVLDNDLHDKVPCDNVVLRGIMGVELDFMKTEVDETKNKLEEAKNRLNLVVEEKEQLKKTFADVIDLELLCSICSDVILEAVSLNCKHTFCKACIVEWKKKKKDCPVCRTKIRAEVSPLLVDSFIDKVVELIGGELEQRRNDLKAERKKAEEDERKLNSGRKRKGPERVGDDVYEVLGGNVVIYDGGLLDAIWLGALRSRPPVVDLTATENANNTPYRGRRRRARR